MKIILGKSKSGKSTKIYEYINEDIKNGIKPILFVPSQTREITELDYINKNKTNGIINVDITTISEYISLLLKKKNMHLEENYISDLEKKILLSSVINENKEKLKLFRNVAKKDGFLNLMYMYVDIFRKNNIASNEIENIELKNKALEYKLKEIYFIFSKYQERINEKYIDNISEINIFNDNINKYKEYFTGSSIYFDGYNNFNKSELQFIKSLLSLNLNVTIAIDTDITCIEDIYSNNTNDIFEIPNKTYLKLLNIANSIKDEKIENIVLYNNYSKANNNLIYLAENVFEYVKNKIDINDDSVNINVYSNVYKEVQAIAYKISKKIREGYRYNDFCIYTTDVKNYESVFSRVFYEYNIPLYIDSKKKIWTSKLTEYILELLEMSSSNITLDFVINLLKKGLNNFDLEELAYLENYILEFNINKYNIKNKLYLNNEGYNETIYDLDRINKIRNDAVNVFYDLVDNLKKENSTKKIIEIIYNHLINDNIFFNYYNLSSNIEDKTYFLYSSKADFKIWENISNVFDSINNIYGKEEINISDFYKLFSTVLSEVYIKTVPPTKDKVIVSDINSSKVGNKKIAFWVGVYDGNFPKKNEEDILFSDSEINELNKNEIDFKETANSKENMQKYNIYEALNNIEEKIYISMPAVDIKNEVTRKSSLITDIESTVDVKIHGEVSNTKDLEIKYDDIYSKEKCFEYMTKKLRNLIDVIDNLDLTKHKDILKKQITDILNIYYYFQNDNEYNEILSYLKNDDNLSKDSVNSIYKEEFKSSVYKLEQFKKCPFAYYMKYILNINKRKVYEITSMDTGSIMHNVLDEFSKYLIQNNIKWKKVIDEKEKIYEIYRQKVIDIINNLLENEFKKQKESVKYGIYKKKLENTMIKVIQVVAKSFRQSDFEVYGNEIEFNDKSSYLPIILKLNEEVSMKIIGKIDRVDMYSEDEKSYIRIVDYKSSQKKLSIDDIKEGTSLQLITYMSAMLENLGKEKKVIPSACLYFNLSDKLINLKDYTKNEDEMKKEIIKKLRMTGLFLKDVKILENMDKYVNDASNKLIDITPNRMNSSKKALEEEEFNNLCKEAEQILKNIGKEMIKGVVKIEPNKNKEVCKYCDFSSICRKESCI